MSRRAVEWNGDILEAIDVPEVFVGSVWRFWIQRELGRMKVGLEVDRTAAVMGVNRLAG